MRITLAKLRSLHVAAIQSPRTMAIHLQIIALLSHTSVSRVIHLRPALTDLRKHHICALYSLTLHTHHQVGERAYPLDQQPGWNQNSCGYHADDGNLYHESGGGSAFGPTCTDGDRMGCGVDFITNCSSDCVIVFFTKNGKQVRSGLV